MRKGGLEKIKKKFLKIKPPLNGTVGIQLFLSDSGDSGSLSQGLIRVFLDGVQALPYLDLILMSGEAWEVTAEEWKREIQGRKNRALAWQLLPTWQFSL